jgi:adenylate cyclase
VFFWEAAKWLFIHQYLWVIVIYPALSAALSTGLVLILLYSSENAERRKTVAQFGRFMAPSILEEVLARPEEDYPRPRRTYATVLFTDLKGFTTYAETHDPEEVVSALNAYMTCMIPIVQRHGGTIDKYIGDSIMAYFGVPLPYDDHAACALRCAVELQDACARFRAETAIEFYMRVGVHTGEVIAGSMGSEGNNDSQPLLNYTVIGDTVNLASRLEGANKEFGSWIMCSAATYEAAPDVACVESASTQIKGKSQIVDVYKVRGLAGELPSDDHWG